MCQKSEAVAVCDECVIFASNKFAGLSDEAVRCHDCGRHEDFAVCYIGAVKTILFFRQAGIDEEGNAIYVARLASGKPLLPKSKFHNAWCGACAHPIPAVAVGLNRYVRLACTPMD